MNPRISICKTQSKGAKGIYPYRMFDLGYLASVDPDVPFL